MTSRFFRTHFVVLFLFVLVPASSTAESYPARPVRMVVPFPPGGGVDTVARIVSLKLSEHIGQPIVIDNRPGGGSVVGTDLVARATADGYTVLLAANSIAIHPVLRKKLPYDVENDFAPVTLVATLPLMLVVNPAMSVHSLKGLISLVQSRPGELNFGSGGTGSLPHLAGELFKSMAGIDIVHVPYRGVVLSLVDLAGGRLSLAFPNVPVGIAFIKSGKVRALAVTSTKRVPALPQTPTMAEAGLPGYEAVAWYALMAPAKTPQYVLKQLHRETTKVLQSQEVRGALLAQGAEPSPSTASQLRELVKSDIKKWGKLIAELNITMD